MKGLAVSSVSESSSISTVTFAMISCISDSFRFLQVRFFFLPRKSRYTVSPDSVWHSSFFLSIVDTQCRDMPISKYWVIRVGWKRKVWFKLLTKCVREHDSANFNILIGGLQDISMTFRLDRTSVRSSFFGLTSETKRREKFPLFFVITNVPKFTEQFASISFGNTFMALKTAVLASGTHHSRLDNFTLAIYTAKTMVPRFLCEYIFPVLSLN